MENSCGNWHQTVSGASSHMDSTNMCSWITPWPVTVKPSEPDDFWGVCIYVGTFGTTLHTLWKRTTIRWDAGYWIYWMNAQTSQAEYLLNLLHLLHNRYQLMILDGGLEWWSCIKCVNFFYGNDGKFMWELAPDCVRCQFPHGFHKHVQLDHLFTSH